MRPAAGDGASVKFLYIGGIPAAEFKRERQGERAMTTTYTTAAGATAFGENTLTKAEIDVRIVSNGQVTITRGWAYYQAEAEGERAYTSIDYEPTQVTGA